MHTELELQGAIVQRLKTDLDVNALVAGRIYDRIPEERVFPYVSIGPVDMLDDSVECITGFEVFQQIDVWSRGVGFPECKTIVDAVRAALHDADLILPTNGLVFIEHRQSRVYRDPDGLTSHGALSFEASIERGN